VIKRFFKSYFAFHYFASGAGGIAKITAANQDEFIPVMKA
jgi:hypothetical protein